MRPQRCPGKLSPRDIDISKRSQVAVRNESGVGNTSFGLQLEDTFGRVVVDWTVEFAVADAEEEFVLF